MTDKTSQTAYQAFIDILTTHSKSINSAFLRTYSKFSEVPDPYPLLEASVDSMLVSEDTLPKVTEENQILQKNITKVTLQLEETESRLEAERSSKNELAEKLETRVKEVEESWKAVLHEKEDNWEAKETALEDKVESQERLISEIKASYEVNKRLGRDESAASHSHVTSAELEMINSDLERTSTRLAEVEARNEQLRLELAEAKSHVPTQAANTVEEDPVYLRLQSECSALVRKLDAARVERDGFKRDMSSKLRGLEREVGLLKDEREALKVKAQKCSDYEDIKHELEVLKSIEFSTGEDDETNGAPEDMAGKDAAPKGKGETLEQLLLARNKKLNDELTMLRVSHKDLQSRLQDLQEEMSRTNAALEKAQNLNQKLEDDLSTLQSEGANAFPSGASVAGTYARGYAPSTGPGRRGGRTSPTSSIINGIDPRGLDKESLSGGAGILPMITAQRDRFKKRNVQLEQELSESHRNVSQLRQEIAALQQDNLNLYEKTRYVSSYNRSGHSGGTSSSSATAYSSNPNPSTVAMGGTGNPGISTPSLERYRKAYESNLSPFAAFRGRESSRAYRRMSLPERAVYSVTRVVLASRMSRNLFAAYCLALHVMVFLCLYWLGSSDVDRNLAGLGQSSVGRGAAAADAPSRGGDNVGAGWKEEGFSH